jgi:predicted O-methyltransferase YrrM
MRFEDIEKIVGHVPFMPASDGKILYEFILASGRKHILELGFAHGTSTCYMAAALDEAGEGDIVTIDNFSARSIEPTLFSLLDNTKLERYVKPLFSGTSYTWELKNLIEQQTRSNSTIPLFDFCFIDGAHAWEPDGLAFFLVETLLAPGGWILFDDLDWTYAQSEGLRDTELVHAMPHDYKTTPQIERVFSLLVMQHPSFENFRREGRWGWAQKKAITPSRSAEILDRIYLNQSIAHDVRQLLRKIFRRLF